MIACFIIGTMFPFKGYIRNNSTKLTREVGRTKGKLIVDVRYISNLLIDYNLRYKLNNKTIHIIINMGHKINKLCFALVFNSKF